MRGKPSEADFGVEAGAVGRVSYIVFGHAASACDAIDRSLLATVQVVRTYE